MTDAVHADAPAPRDAATIILYRRRPGGPAVLMGQRGAGAAFMPEKYVFPGGAADDDDHDIPRHRVLNRVCRDRLCVDAPPSLAGILPATAIRELWEETGLLLAGPGKWDRAIPHDWAGFAATGHLPDAGALTFIFRAITPPGRSRRFDARFFLADSAALASDPDDLAGGSGELSHLHWVSLTDARKLNLPFITEIVLAEIAHLGSTGDPPPSVPFFDNSGPHSVFRRIV